ncbi:hypothetical protein AWH61_19580 [Alteromonas sp. W12]|uniref:hypothetical protein n=1 Tax=Alteromonas sp. W12 TaxID=1772289 RepID=UPI000948EBB7|nr:hypothetical protein [Alteromonas sp. W12]OLF77621.1 hypothetical protein AWH61_19580 [Alteromonas sp. W12]
MSEQLFQALMSPKATVGMVCLLLILAGIMSIKQMKSNSPLAPYVLQILGLTFILPIVVLLTTIIEVDGQALMGLLGTIVGYIFGTSKTQTDKPRILVKQSKDDSNDA